MSSFASLQALACLEGVFAGKALDIAFCDASDDTASIAGNSSERTGGERLLCTGYNANGTVTIKGLVLPSLSEAFSIGLIEVPTCLGVAGTQTLLAVGYVDGTVQVMQFAEDRCGMCRQCRSAGPIVVCYVFDVYVGNRQMRTISGHHFVFVNTERTGNNPVC